MHLEKYSQNSITHTNIQEALKTGMIRNVREEALRRAIGVAVGKAFQDSGQTIEEEDSRYLSSVLPEEIKRQFPNLRISEISIAINRGVHGDYGKYYGLNTVSFISFIKQYMESEERIKAAKELNKAIEPETPIPSPEEVQERVRKVITKAYQTFLDKGFYEDYGNFIYDKMDEMGLISLSTSRKAQIYQQAQQSLISKRNPQNAGNLQEFKEFTSSMELISNPDSISGKDMIKKEAKKIALQVVFSDFSEVETDINELVNQKQNF